MVATPSEQETIDTSNVPANASRVLVVDDEEIIRTLLGEILTEEGYTVTFAATGTEAIAHLQSSGLFDLVITDMVMPGVNGVEVLQAAFRIDPTYPVIMITGYPSVDTAVKLVSLGAADYIAKPFNVDLIKVTVAKVLQIGRMRGGGPAPAAPAAPAAPGEDAGNFDKLTGIYDATLFKSMLDSEMGRAAYRKRLFSLMLVEIDHFEEFTANDTAAAGIQLLQTFVSLLKQESRPGDLMGRLGTAEIGILFPETNRDEVEARGKKMQELAETKFTFSGGLVSYPRDGTDIDTLIKTAHSAVEFAKFKGGNQIFMPQ